MKQDSFPDCSVLDPDFPMGSKPITANDKQRLKILSTVSHEIRTPLNAIIGIADLLQKKLSKEEQEEYIAILKLTSENLLELVNNVLDYSKMQSGRLNLLSKPFNLRKCIKRSLFSQKANAESHGIELLVDIDKELPQVLLGDSVKVCQIVLNLISNAIKFTEGGCVRLQLKMASKTPSGVSVLFLVCDTGIGIPREQLQNIFKAFNQGGEDINLKYSGTGLGLSISNQLVKLFGGKLSVKSELGMGSEFSFQLNFKTVSDMETMVSPPKGKSIKKRAKGIKVLLAEDNKINTMVVEKYFDLWGIEYTSVENGLEAVEIIQKQDFEVVLMDLQMPIMDGFEATRKIRALHGEKYQKLPIIALTASSENFYQQEIRDCGMNDQISKPFQPETLLARIVSSVS